MAHLIRPCFRNYLSVVNFSDAYKAWSRLSKCVSESFPPFRLNYNPFHFHLAFLIYPWSNPKREFACSILSSALIREDFRGVLFTLFFCFLKGELLSQTHSGDHSVTFADESLRSDQSLKCISGEEKMEKVHFPADKGNWIIAGLLSDFKPPTRI